jgi:two-component sensor histidine kinase/PAS domain-containing protein
MDETRALRREVKRLEFELGAAVSQVPLLRAMVNGSRDGLALLDEGGQILEHNEAFGRMIAEAAIDLGNLRLPDILEPADEGGPLWPASPFLAEAPRIARPLPLSVQPPSPPAGMCAPLSRVKARPSPTSTEATPPAAPPPQAARATSEALLELIVTPTDGPHLWVASARVLTEATLHARALHEARRRVADLTIELDAQRRYASLFEHSPDALLLFGASGRLLQRNALAAAWWPSLNAGMQVGSDLGPLAQAIERHCMLGDACANAGSRANVEWHDSSAEGDRYVQATVVPIVVPDGCGALVSARDITAHRRAERALEVALEKASMTLAEREVLLKEVHHRVKNNLQIIASLLAMQSDRAPPEAQRALSESTYRIRSMALVHEMLYGGADLARVEIGAYVSQLAQELRSALCPTAELTLDTCPFEVAIDEAIPVGLLINELLTNAFKHGRSADGRCRVTVCIQRPSAGRVCIAVSDAGPGLPTRTSPRPSSLGMTIASALARQLDATLSISEPPGATFSLVFDTSTSAESPRATPH